MGQVKALWQERIERLQDRWARQALKAAQARAHLVTRYRTRQQARQRRRLLRRHG